ncbi:MAG: S41 family peptidase, partial [Verrucomicrobiota bacterium]
MRIASIIGLAVFALGMSQYYQLSELIVLSPRVNTINSGGPIGGGAGEPSKNPVDDLNQANLQEAFRLLTSEYIRRGDLDSLEVNRAALQGILERRDFGAMLVTQSELEAQDAPYDFYFETLTPEIGYARFGKYKGDEIKAFDGAVSEFKKTKKAKTLIIDLRSPQAQADFQVAADILSRFVAPNELLFKIRRPGSDRATLFLSKEPELNWRKQIVLLMDSETGNVGEIIAAALRRRISGVENLVSIGEPTRGQTVEYRDVPVAEDRILRYAIAEVVLDDDSSLYQIGVKPELETPCDLNAKHFLFSQIDAGKTLTTFLFPRERPRNSEASLVAKTNP